jgi:pSer/pThr/pTyr-binding forkhead associated (FHA) protein
MAKTNAATDIRETIDPRLRPAPFGAPHVFVLVVVEGDDPAGAYRIGRTETTLGRGEEADLSLDDEQVSKKHCKIRVDGPVCTVVDLGSRNGTTVNGRKLPQGTAQRVRHLDEIEIGSHKLMVLAGRFRGTPKNTS